MRKLSKPLKLFGISVVVVSSLVLIMMTKKNFVKEETPLCKDCNVILVSLDTLSANHLPCYGYNRNTAPNLCNFANNNILFSKAFANSHWTLPSTVSIFTGLYPSYHGINIERVDRLSRKIKILPEILQTYGYNTIFLMPSDDDIALPLDLVYDRGIDTFYASKATPWSEALEKFKKNVEFGRKTFLFLHSYAVHAPYLVGDGPRLYTKDNIPEILIKDSQITQIYTQIEFYRFLEEGLNEYLQSKEPDANLVPIYKDILSIIDKNDEDPILLSKLLEKHRNYYWGYAISFGYFKKINVHNLRHIDYLRALYDESIYNLDNGELLKLFSLFQDQKINDSTLLVITADHGEEFMEHGHITHKTLYDSNLHVPLILHIPKLNISKRISTSVELVDITPTVLDILGLKYQGKFQGVSLTPLIFDQKLTKTLLVAESNYSGLRVIRKDNWKLFLARQEDGSYMPYELYDTSKDPLEKENILFLHNDVKDEIISKFEELVKKWSKIN